LVGEKEADSKYNKGKEKVDLVLTLRNYLYVAAIANPREGREKKKKREEKKRISKVGRKGVLRT